MLGDAGSTVDRPHHHAVGMGCLANFDIGYSRYRGKITRDAATLAEMLRPSGYRNCMIGKWHVSPLTETGATGPFDGWPLGRGFDRFYGFMDAETDQYAPERVSDNGHVTPPGTCKDGYRLTSDLIDNAIRFIADHTADRPNLPWLTWVALSACHAPHQAPRGLIVPYDHMFADGWDAERERRLARQKAMGVVPPDTVLPVRNDGVRAWSEVSAPEQKVFTRLQSAYAVVLEHADQHLARLMDFLTRAGQLENTIVLVLSDNGASQEGGSSGMVNAMGPYNLRPEPMAEKRARIDDIGGPDSHSNFPQGWAMASNTPLRRYKQNTHGGGIRDPLIITWERGISARGALRNQFCHASDVVPTLLDMIGIAPPATIDGRPQAPFDGTSFSGSLANPTAPAKTTPQYFEMFGHRGIWSNGWKAVAYHPTGTPFDSDKWELFHLDADFSEVNDRASAEPENLKALIDLWWSEAERNQVLPLDDRFGPRFAENAKRFHGARRKFVFHRGMGHVPTDVAPEVHSRSYAIDAHVVLKDTSSGGVLIAHGDATTGYSLYIKDGKLVHDMNVGGQHVIVESTRPLPSGECHLGLRCRRLTRETPPKFGVGQGISEFTLLINGEAAGSTTTPLGFVNFISWSGLDIGLDRSSPVSKAYAAPFQFTGNPIKVTVTMDDD